MLPLWPKILYAIFLCILVPTYWIRYGPKNFLWFSDIALFLLGASLWLESSLLASMAALSVLLLEGFAQKLRTPKAFANSSPGLGLQPWGLRASVIQR